ncbi:uncharacterized protein LOC133332775 [Musca vetustissima]|uniref:uncharacterized protein LOC133332775 n=1 Tax=Musca vetustissima TaxID=27455 RepID=UPI002AB6C223|nr:uncharacterized protein LOC133332775 [Musca vetustissima]
MLINGGTNNTCQKSTSTATPPVTATTTTTTVTTPSIFRTRKSSLAADEVDATSANSNNKTKTLEQEIEVKNVDGVNVDKTNHTTSMSANNSSALSSSVQLRTSSTAGGNATATSATIPRCSLKQYGSVNATTSSTNPPTMTVDNPNESFEEDQAGSTTLFANVTNGDNSPSSSSSLAATTEQLAESASNCRSKLEALANLDLPFNLSNLPLDIDDDDDPYFVLQEYLERVKVSGQ